uniref:Uncharacterized protein n=1 Tax=Nicotiana tabacum TaxID=4097 RepID=A0A1S3YD62_TOBAC|nr:PREDICTED: uncharacterized protein LOC107774914 [Nicotiana tabacum]
MRRTKISITREKWTQGYIPKVALTFSEEDTKALSQPHINALVISFLVNSFQIRRVLVDPGSSANIVRSRVIEQLRLLDQIVLATRALNGFNMASEMMKGEIIIPVTMASMTQDTKFHINQGDMRYNALFGQPWIHCIRAVPSTLHQIIKFPTKDGMKTIYGEQHAARKMFAIHDVVPMLIPPPPDKPKGKSGLDLGRA